MNAHWNKNQLSLIWGSIVRTCIRGGSFKTDKSALTFGCTHCSRIVQPPTSINFLKAFQQLKNWNLSDYELKVLSSTESVHLLSFSR